MPADSPNVAVVRRLYDSKGDPAVARELMSRDISWDVTPGFPSGGVYHGAESVSRDFFGSLRPLFEYFQPVGDEFFEAADRVFVLGHYHSLTKAGHTTDARFAHVWTVRDGRLTSLWQTADTVVIDRALAG
ncbi:nuclear transport factor 2 family protein [Streptomyces mayteni]